MIQQTSIDAYMKHKTKARGQRDRVFKYFLRHPDTTNVECASYLRIPASTVSARRSELKNKLISTGQRTCKITGATAKTWRVI